MCPRSSSHHHHLDYHLAHHIGKLLKLRFAGTMMLCPTVAFHLRRQHRWVSLKPILNVVKSRSQVSALEALHLVSAASRCVVSVSLFWRIVAETQEPTSAHQDPDVEDRSQRFRHIPLCAMQLLSRNCSLSFWNSLQVTRTFFPSVLQSLTLELALLLIHKKQQTKGAQCAMFHTSNKQLTKRSQTLESC